MLNKERLDEIARRYGIDNLTTNKKDEGIRSAVVSSAVSNEGIAPPNIRNAVSPAGDASDKQSGPDSTAMALARMLLSGDGLITRNAPQSGDIQGSLSRPPINGDKPSR